MVKKWPTIVRLQYDIDENNYFNVFREVVSKVRHVKGTFGIEKQNSISIVFVSENTKLKNYLSDVFPYIQKLTAVSSITYNEMEIEDKCIIEKLEDYTLQFPITKDYKVDGKFRICIMHCVLLT